VLPVTLVLGALLLSSILAQSPPPPPPPPSPTTLLDQIEAAVAALRAHLAPPETVVTTSAGLTAALLAGGRIRLEAGAYPGNFAIRVNGTTLAGPLEAVLTPADGSKPTLSVLANDVTVTGLHVLGGIVQQTAVVVGDPDATSADAQPHRVTLDGVTVTAGPNGGAKGLALHGVDLTVTRSTVEGFRSNLKESQAIWINNGPGPYTITDNHLEGAGEVILIGGDHMPIAGNVPQHITVRGNTLLKPAAWRTQTPTLKNIFEVKCGRSVVLENNTLDGNWVQGQDGSSILLTARNQYGDTPQCGWDDVVVRGNTLRNAPQGYSLNILGSDNNYPSIQAQTLLVEHNLFVDASNGIRVSRGVATALIVRQNTWPAIGGSLLQFESPSVIAPLTPLTFTANVARSGAYGITLSNTTVGLPSLMASVTLVDWSGNIIEKTAARTIKWPAGTTLVEPGGLAALLDPTTYKLLAGGAGY
jgi:hypothetical protein